MRAPSGCEVASLPDWNAHGPEVAVGHGALDGLMPQRPIAAGLSLDDRRCDPAVRERRTINERGRCDAGQASHGVEHLSRARETRSATQCCRWICVQHHQMIRIEAECFTLQPCKATRRQGCADEQQRGESDFARDQAAAQSKRGDSSTASLLEVGHDVDARGSHRRRHTEDESRRDRDERCKQEHERR